MDKQNLSKQERYEAAKRFFDMDCKWTRSELDSFVKETNSRLDDLKTAIERRMSNLIQAEASDMYDPPKHMAIIFEEIQEEILRTFAVIDQSTVRVRIGSLKTTETEMLKAQFAALEELQ